MQTINHFISETVEFAWRLVLLFSCGGSLAAENLFGPNDTADPLVIADNQAIVITAHSKWTSLKIRMGASEVPAFLDEGLEGFAIGGPAQVCLIDEVGNPPFIQFVRRSNSVIHTLLATPAAPTELVIPDGKTAHFFQTFHETQTLASIQHGTKTYVVNLLRGTELTGPLTLRFSIGNGNPTTGVAVSFYFTEDAERVLDLSAIKAPTGNFQTTVEQSKDLKLWVPFFIAESMNDERSFFRLKVEK